MNLYIADVEAHYLRNAIHDILTVLLLRVEKRVLWPLTDTVAGGVVCDPRPPVAPLANAAQSQFNRRSHAPRLVVICH
jgi:hypothetical protein